MKKKKNKIWKTPAIRNNTVVEQLKEYPISDANWKMFHDYVKMMAVITVRGGTIICADPNGIYRTFINN